MCIDMHADMRATCPTHLWRTRRDSSDSASRMLIACLRTFLLHAYTHAYTRAYCMPIACLLHEGRDRGLCVVVHVTTPHRAAKHYPATRSHPFRHRDSRHVAQYAHARCACVCASVRACVHTCACTHKCARTVVQAHARSRTHARGSRADNASLHARACVSQIRATVTTLKTPTSL